MYYAIGCTHEQKAHGGMGRGQQKHSVMMLIGFIVRFEANEASFLTVLTNLLCLRVAQIPRS